MSFGAVIGWPQRNQGPAMFEDRRTRTGSSAARMERLRRFLVASDYRALRDLAIFIYFTSLAVVSITATIVSIVRTYAGPTDAIIVGVLILLDVAAVAAAVVGWIITPRRPRRDRP